MVQNNPAIAEPSPRFIPRVPVHSWYSFVLSYPSTLVHTYLKKFGLSKSSLVLDPFCGTGTTLVACKGAGIPSVGIESNPMAHFASSAKIDWSVDPNRLLAHANQVGNKARARLQADGLDTSPGLPLFPTNGAACARNGLLSFTEVEWKLLQRNAISPLPLHKTLVLRETLRDLRDEATRQHELLALARVAVSVSNLRFGPEVGLGPIKADAAVIELWLQAVRDIANDVAAVELKPSASSRVYVGDARRVHELVVGNSVDGVITSPPYPNEKDYTRTTRLESVLLGLISDKAQLRAVKKNLVRSNTRGVYKEDTDDRVQFPIPDVDELALAIDRRREELGKTSGFEKLYGRLTKLYFGGMFRHLNHLRDVLRPGAQLAYVVGDQASYFRILIRTGEITAKLAASLGYEVVGIDLFRTRAATATKSQLREEVVLLRWPG